MKEKFMSRMIFQVALQLLNILSAYFFVKFIAVELLGVTGRISSYIGIFTMFLTIGLDSIYLQHSGESDFSTFFSNFFFIKSTLLIVSFIALFIFIIIVDFEFKAYFFLIAFSEILIRFTQIINTHLRAILKIYKAEIPNFVIGFLNAIIKIILSFNISKFSSPLSVFALNSVFFAMINLGITIYISKGERVKSRINKKRIIQLLKETSPLIFSSIILIFNENISNLIIDYAYGAEEFTYYYFVRAFIIVTLTTFTLSISVIYESYFAKWFNKGRTEEIQKMTRKVEKYTAIFYVVIIILTFLNGGLAFKIFLPEYQNALVILYILIFTPLIGGLNRPYSKHLYAGKKQKIVSKYLTIRSVLFLIFLLIIVPEEIGPVRLFGFGVYGLCALRLSFLILDYLVFKYYSWKLFSIRGEKRLFILLPLALISLGISYLFKDLIQLYVEYDFLILLLSSLFGVVIFIILSYIFKIIKQEDLTFFREILRLSNYSESIKEEFQEKHP
ncbi:lipopolysaccharide biosynthesis protein [Candidatus Lokiarchaeum ossiferum]|uniref:lipopolysaccharide biosynthesis protein n=1 Tax=Candidatus Lokiarchaeum ossiferum TaxID=2951803 RepID=UPI00352C71F5